MQVRNATGRGAPSRRWTRLFEVKGDPDHQAVGVHPPWGLQPRVIAKSPQACTRVGIQIRHPDARRPSHYSRIMK